MKMEMLACAGWGDQTGNNEDGQSSPGLAVGCNTTLVHLVVYRCRRPRGQRLSPREWEG